MAGTVAGWLLTTELRIWPGRRVTMAALLRDGQLWRFPIECPALGMVILIEGEPGPHELGFALSYGDDEKEILPPLIITAECHLERSWLFLERGPHEFPGAGTYFVDISLDGEIVEETQFTLEDITKKRPAHARTAPDKPG